VQDARQWIVDLFSQILFVVKSVNALFSGKIALNVEAMGIIMLIIDLMNLIMMVIVLKKEGLKGCEDLKDNPEKVLRAFKRTYPNIEFSLSPDGKEVRASDRTGLHKRAIPLPECSGDLTDVERQRLRDGMARITGTLSNS
jgi:hypothetical protein